MERASAEDVCAADGHFIECVLAEGGMPASLPGLRHRRWQYRPAQETAAANAREGMWLMDLRQEARGNIGARGGWCEIGREFQRVGKCWQSLSSH